jgi:hypothetical protein
MALLHSQSYGCLELGLDSPYQTWSTVNNTAISAVRGDPIRRCETIAPTVVNVRTAAAPRARRGRRTAKAQRNWIKQVT